MQPYVVPLFPLRNAWILKQPGKAIFYLFTIMILIVKESHEHGRCNHNCFGPVTRLKIYNELSHGYLHVNGSNVVTTDESDGILYKISSGRNFYLYDMRAEKFICWRSRRPRATRELRNKARHRMHSPLIARNFSNPKCRFQDLVAEGGVGYVNLAPAFNRSLLMKFNSRGRFVTQECTPSTKEVRKRHLCAKQTNFLIDDGDACECREAERHFCRAKFAKMKEFRSVCKTSNRINGL
ncbi:uncharacterized protein LOC114334647 isoform X2 [Diabrotica virgifera virgifera]|uniref:Uncharacterized protein LOC114334647 isoform X3 n=1 Tax=Diabrotica virgifera virgifera TaxID=50390 RepID=A0A6P7FVX9_DIAVI|nr:uncharacterized protein LOC114334647 isoform X2 [Diabrotica virgifera virgifera]